MNAEHDEDMRKARMYLQMDERELANVRAEHEKYERRKAAMQRGDQGSPIPGSTECECGPLTFAPIHCTSCGIKLTSQNHDAHRMCQRCAEEDQALTNFEAARQKLIAENKKVRGIFWPAMAWAVAVVLAATVVPMGLAWLWDKAAWAIGQVWP
jgi:predicted RNA-binding Zn-ribbon protein involved in translation (DUF1610 family)